jgi:hypothetical protein
VGLLEARIFTFYKQLLGVSHDAMRVNELKALRKEHKNYAAEIFSTKRAK